MWLTATTPVFFTSNVVYGTESQPRDVLVMFLEEMSTKVSSSYVSQVPRLRVDCSELNNKAHR